MSRRWIEFHEVKLDGCIAPALGSDAILPLDRRLGAARIEQVARAHANQLLALGKQYVGYAIISGSTVRAAKRIGPWHDLRRKQP